MALAEAGDSITYKTNSETVADYSNKVRFGDCGDLRGSLKINMEKSDPAVKYKLYKCASDAHSWLLSQEVAFSDFYVYPDSVKNLPDTLRAAMYQSSGANYRATLMCKAKPEYKLNISDVSQILDCTR